MIYPLCGVQTKLLFLLPVQTQLALLLLDGEWSSQILFLTCSELILAEISVEKFPKKPRWWTSYLSCRPATYNSTKTNLLYHWYFSGNSPQLQKLWASVFLITNTLFHRYLYHFLAFETLRFWKEAILKITKKPYRSSRPEVFCRNVVLRNFWS